MEYVYTCAKLGGETFTYTSPLENLSPQDAYAWRRGVREYADNYHAGLVRKSKDGTEYPGNFAADVKAACIEARDRFHAGDVPTERGVVNPKVAETRKIAAFLLSKGLTLAQVEALIEKNEKPAKSVKAA